MQWVTKMLHRLEDCLLVQSVCLQKSFDDIFSSWELEFSAMPLHPNLHERSLQALHDLGMLSRQIIALIGVGGNIV